LHSWAISSWFTASWEQHLRGVFCTRQSGRN
jgi:hypothetical protein